MSRPKSCIWSASSRCEMPRNFRRREIVLPHKLFFPSFALFINIANTNTAAVTGGVPMRRPVKKVVYCLLALFLGWLGAHKFYAGRTGTGILYLFFCWTGIPAILAVIDFIVGLFKATDGNGCFLYY